MYFKSRLERLSSSTSLYIINVRSLGVERLPRLAHQSVRNAQGRWVITVHDGPVLCSKNAGLWSLPVLVLPEVRDQLILRLISGHLHFLLYIYRKINFKINSWCNFLFCYRLKFNIAPPFLFGGHTNDHPNHDS